MRSTYRCDQRAALWLLSAALFSSAACTKLAAPASVDGGTQAGNAAATARRKPWLDPTGWVADAAPTAPSPGDAGMPSTQSSATDPAIASTADAAGASNPVDAPDASALDASMPVAVPQPPAPTASVVLMDHASSQPEQTLSEFSISAIQELYVYTVWSELSGSHFELRKYYAPSGDLYYQRLLPFSTELDEPVPFTLAVDVPHPAVIRPLTPDADGHLIVEDYLGLAGTWIGDHGMTGPWTLAIHLDGAETPIQTVHFELVP